MRGQWREVPRSIRLAVIAQAAVLAYGGVVHVVQLAVGGWTPYRWAPIWLAIYFTALTGLDPLATLLLVRRRAIGLYLAAGVLVTDAAANWYAVYRLHSGSEAARIAQAVISILALSSLLTARCARPWFSSCRSRDATCLDVEHTGRTANPS